MPSPKVPRNAEGLNQSGNGRGIGVATRHERGVRPPKTAPSKQKDKTIAEVRVRGNYSNNTQTAALIDPEKPLTDLQKSFVRYWASGETILSASIKAGYSDNGTFAYRLVRMPNIIKLYNEEKAKYEEAAQMSRKKVMDMLLESYDTAKTLAEPATMVSAAREIGKMCGYYEPVKVRHEVSIEGKVVVERLNKMSDEDLLKFIEESAKQIAAEPQPQLLEHETDADATEDGQ